MPELIQKNDFIEIEFTGASDGKIFDTTNPKEAEEIGMHDSSKIKPIIISVGNQMLLQGLDEYLEGREFNKEYKISLKPEKAFGKRNSKLIRTYPLTAFTKNKINPYPGMALQLDNAVAKVLSVSGGRVMVDFNNPLAGKEIDYTFKAKRKITDDTERINALQDFFFKQRFEFVINEDAKKVIFKNQDVSSILAFLGEKFKEMTGFEFEIEEEKPGEKKESGISKKDKGKR